MNCATTLLGVMEIETDPIAYGDFLGLVKTWLQDVGGFAMIGLVFWLIHATLRMPRQLKSGSGRAPVTSTMWIGFLGALLCYVAAGVVYTSGVIPFVEENGPIERTVRTQDGVPFQVVRDWGKSEILLDWLSTLAGGLAILAFAEPFLRDLMRFRWRRIMAIARLSFREAVRRKVVWVFLLLLIIPMFPAKWFVEKPKAENELRTSISVIYFAMPILTVVIGVLLTAFAIPTDIKNQTIHTVVTKPVERFEVMFGRYLGYLGLVTVSVFALTGFSLIWIHAGDVNELAKAETMRARRPVYGEFEIRGKRAGYQGVSVGREHEYRRYIAGGPDVINRAYYSFRDIPSGLGDGVDRVKLEFQFDIYRTTKGEENRGVFVSFDLITPKWREDRQADYEAAVRKASGSYPAPAATATDPARWQDLSGVAQEFGRFEVRNVEIYDYHSSVVEIPVGLFSTAREKAPPTPEGARPFPAVLAVVKCESRTQFIGLARYDLFLLDGEGSFDLNFFKAAIGLWCQLAIILGIAVVCSTYLAGLLSWLYTKVFIILGLVLPFIRTLATNDQPQGGPFESLNRLAKGDNSSSALDETAIVNVSQSLDSAFRWGLGRVLNAIPDLQKFGWTDYVAEGFSIRPEFLLMHLLLVAGYLIPWFLIGYYLLKSREVAA